MVDLAVDLVGDLLVDLVGDVAADLVGGRSVDLGSSDGIFFIRGSGLGGVLNSNSKHLRSTIFRKI